MYSGTAENRLIFFLQSLNPLALVNRIAPRDLQAMCTHTQGSRESILETELQITSRKMGWPSQQNHSTLQILLG